MGNFAYIGTVILVVVVVDIILIGLAIFFISRYVNERSRKEQATKADGIILAASEKAKETELEAKDRAIKILQEAENDINRRRSEILKEDERQQKRRIEVDARVERLEQREQALNKRQSALDKRLNEIEKMYDQQMTELQRIGQMTVEEARAMLLVEAEKEARNDMARIIRQIEAEALRSLRGPSLAGRLHSYLEY